MEPRYPDEFDETAQAAWGADATVIAPVTAADAGAATAPIGPSGILPIQPTGPQGGADAGRIDTPSRVPDAGVVFPGPRLDATAGRDAGATPPPVDAGSQDGVDAQVGAPAAGAVTSCSITATTHADDAFFYRGKYGCGVWIANSAGKAVKVFLVATRIASRSGLSAYRTATSGVTVDVTASATLQAARQHQYTWDLKDMSGMPVAPGSYKLAIETHSESGVALVTVPFDTSKGPVSETGTPSIDVRSASIKCN